MSNIYRKFREQIAAGGDPQDQVEAKSGNGFVSLIALVAFLAWIASLNPWMLVFAVGLIISIFLHEFGHYWTAKKTGMKVTQFYMGFGPRLWSRQRGELEYGVRAIPLGAFVRIVGMSNLDDCDPQDESRSYRSQTYPRRLLVITAGSLMHMIIAVVLFATVYSTAGRLGETGSVRILFPPVEGTPAAQVGLREGDVISAIDDSEIATRDQLVEVITSHKPGESISLEILRGDQVIFEEAELAVNPINSEIGYLGVGTDSVDYLQQSIPEAVGYAFRDGVDAIVNSVKALPQVFNPANVIDSISSTTADPQTRPSLSLIHI